MKTSQPQVKTIDFFKKIAMLKQSKRQFFFLILMLLVTQMLSIQSVTNIFGNNNNSSYFKTLGEFGLESINSVLISNILICD